MASLRKETAGLMGRAQTKALLWSKLPFWLQAGPAWPSWITCGCNQRERPCSGQENRCFGKTYPWELGKMCCPRNTFSPRLQGHEFLWFLMSTLATKGKYHPIENSLRTYKWILGFGHPCVRRDMKLSLSFADQCVICGEGCDSVTRTYISNL